MLSDVTNVYVAAAARVVLAFPHSGWSPTDMDAGAWVSLGRTPLAQNAEFPLHWGL